MNAAHDAVHANMYDTMSKDVSTAAFETVYGTVYVGVRRRVRTPVGNAVYDAVSVAVDGVNVLDQNTINTVMELL